MILRHGLSTVSNKGSGIPPENFAQLSQQVIEYMTFHTVGFLSQQVVESLISFDVVVSFSQQVVEVLETNV